MAPSTKGIRTMNFFARFTRAGRLCGTLMAMTVAAEAVALTCPVVQPANELWVSPTGTDDPANGAVANPLRTLAYACSRAQVGQTIFLAAGEFRETAQCVLRSGVRIAGQGRTGTARTSVYAPASWDFTGDGVNDNTAGYVVKIDGVQDVTVEQVEFRGTNNRANGAVLVSNSERVLLRDLGVYDFRYIGLQAQRSTKVTAQNISIENSGLEWPPNTSAQFPDGGSLGNLGVFSVDDSVFERINIKTTDLRGYGIKATNLSKVRFTRMDLDLHPYQSWRGPSLGNFDMEIHGGYAELVEISHSNFKQTLSMSGGSEPRYDLVPYTIHIHHNMFDQRAGAYGIELITDKMVVDHNWFRGTWTALQNFGDSSARTRELTVFNNIADNISMRFIGLNGRVEHLRAFNNTVYLGPGGGQSYLVVVGSNNESRNWLLANNVVVGSLSNPALNRQFAISYLNNTAPRDLDVRHNVYRDINRGVTINDTVADPAQWNHVYTNNLDAEPGLPTTGATAFQPTASSAVIDKGDVNIGIRSSFTGAGRDVGAFEFGEPAWQAGVASNSDVQYLWAPTTSVKQGAFVDFIDVDLNAPAGSEIRYTLDGSEPGINATRYVAPIRISDPARLRARTFKDGFASATALSLDLVKGVQGYPNLAAGKPATASSVYPERDGQGNLNYAPSKAFDDITTGIGGWSPNTGDARPWLQVDLGSAARIRYLELFTREVIDSVETRRNFEIRASNDPAFATYVVLASQGSTPIAHQDVMRVTVTDVTPYRYIRAAKTADEYFFVNELRVRGEP